MLNNQFKLNLLHKAVYHSCKEDQNKMLEIGKKIKSFRQIKGWSQAEIAEMLNISVPAFSKIETDITDINVSRLKQIADIFGVPITDMLTTGSTENVKYNDELKTAKETVDSQALKISHLQEYIITLYEELHKSKQTLVIHKQNI